MAQGSRFGIFAAGFAEEAEGVRIHPEGMKAVSPRSLRRSAPGVKVDWMIHDPEGIEANAVQISREGVGCAKLSQLN